MHTHLRSNKVTVHKKKDSIQSKVLGKFIKKMVKALFSDLFKRLVKRELGIGLLEDLNDIGVKI